MSWFDLWWAWIVIGFALGVLEVLAPGYIFLGFAVGAVATGGLVGIGILGGLPVTLLVFAVASLVAWWVMRKMLGSHAGKVKLWDRDINDN